MSEIEELLRCMPTWCWVFLIPFIILGILARFMCKNGNGINFNNIWHSSKVSGDNNNVDVNNTLINGSVIYPVVNNDSISVGSIIFQLHKNIAEYNKLSKELSIARIDERGLSNYREKENEKDKLSEIIIAHSEALASQLQMHDIQINSVQDAKRLMEIINSKGKESNEL